MSDDEKVELANLSVREASIIGPFRGYLEALRMTLECLIFVSGVNPTELRDLMYQTSTIVSEGMRKWHVEGMTEEVLETYRAAMLDGFDEFLQHVIEVSLPPSEPKDGIPGVRWYR